MIIQETIEMVKKPVIGRPAVYPFDKLLPGQHIVIPVTHPEGIKTQCMLVSSAIGNFKKRNNLTWYTKVRNAGDSIHVYRLK